MAPLRAVLAVVLGYAVMGVLIAGGSLALAMSFGVEWWFEFGTYSHTPAFIACAFALIAAAAVAAGFVCRLIARSLVPVLVLAGCVLAVGAAGACMNSGLSDGGRRAPDSPVMESIQRATQPPWCDWSVPVVTSLGTVLGGSLVRRGTIQHPGSTPNA